MEVLKNLRRILFASTVMLFAVSCEYFGFDGYINQLNELGISSELADAVTFNQHMTSRPREFEGKVYVLGTRGVFEMEAGELTDYRFYPFSQDLGYPDDFWDDRLPPINCYRDPADGTVVIMSLNSNQGLKYGDTLRLNTAAGIASYAAANMSAGDPPVGFLTNATVRNYVMTDLWDYAADTVELTDDPLNAGSYSSTTASDRFVMNSSFRNVSGGTSMFVVLQQGSTIWGTAPTSLFVHELSTASWDLTTPVGSVYLDLPVSHTEYKYTVAGYYTSQDLRVSTNNRYLLVYGESLNDEGTMILYDYLSGDRMLTTDIPGNKLFPELGEEGMTIFASSIRGGVAKYVYD